MVSPAPLQYTSHVSRKTSHIMHLTHVLWVPSHSSYTQPSSILSVKVNCTFLRASMDTGATIRVIGSRQDTSYTKFSGNDISISKMHRTLRFRDGLQHSTGRVKVRIPTPKNSYIHLCIDVFDVDITLLFGLDVISIEGFVIEMFKDGLKIVHLRIENLQISFCQPPAWTHIYAMAFSFGPFHRLGTT